MWLNHDTIKNQILDKDLAMKQRKKLYVEKVYENFSGGLERYRVLAYSYLFGVEVGQLLDKKELRILEKKVHFLCIRT